MPNSIDRNNPFDSDASGLDISYLQELLMQQAQRRRLYENIAILGCGYVGSMLADFWQAQGHFVTGTTTTPEKVADLSETLSRVVLLKGEDADAVKSLVDGQDTVVVTIAPIGSRLADEATYEVTYIPTARNLCQALSEASTVKRLIYISSCSIYGDRQGNWVDEEAAITPSDFRTQVLYEAEQIIAEAASDTLKVCILRLGGIYGPGRELVQIFGGLAGTTLPGTGDRVVNWVHLDDVLGAIEFARAQELEGLYNVVDDSQLTVKEQIQQICLQHELPPIHWDPSKPSHRRKSLRVSNQKLKAAGYQLFHPSLLV